jgi:hypothetical protein
MADKPHPVVELLVARMESHPEEFRVADGPERWVTHIDMVQDYGSEADKAALNAKLRDIVMGEVHEDVMDELLNGEDRRRKEEEEQEYERNLSKSLLLTKQQMQQQQAQQNAMMSQYKNAYAGQLGQLGAYNQAQAVGLSGQSPSSVWLDEHGIAGTLTTKPTLSSSAINQIKKALNL